MIILGAIAEGETVLLTGGLLAWYGYLDLPLVIIAGLIGAVAGDQFFFLLGRRFGSYFFMKRHTLRNRVDRVERYFMQYKIIILVGFRFFYGLRSAIPFFVGLSSIHAKRFLLFNMIGASIWAITVGIAGYFLGSLAGKILAENKELIIKAIPVTLGTIWLLVFLIHYGMRRRRNTVSFRSDKENC